MKKVKSLICALLCISILCLGACGTTGSGDNGTGDNGTGETTTAAPGSGATESTPGGTTDGGDGNKPTDEVKRVKLQLNNNDVMNYQVVYSLDLSEDGREALKKFSTNMQELIGIKTKSVIDTVTPQSEIKEIIVGETNREKTVSPERYATYGIKTYEDGTVAIYGSNGEMLGKALNTFINGITKLEDGNYYYCGLEYIESSMSEFLSQLPIAKFGSIETIYESHKNVYQVSIKNATADNLADYGKQLTDAGYTLHATNSIDANNKFATYKSAENAVHLGYHASNSTLEIIVEKLGYLPPAAAVNATKKVDASITQMKMDQSDGMSYVIQLIDGSFVVIDGGVWEAAYAKELIELLEAKNAGTGYAKPQVTWMFTHSHPDHVQLAETFISGYANRFDLVTVCANFIELNTSYSNTIGDGYGFTILMNNIAKKFPNANIFTFHTGQVLYLAGCKIDFYLTHEDLYPTALGTLNSASSVWKFTFDGGKTFIILGDTTETGAQLLNSYYGASLKSDFMQAAHHGTTASSGIVYLKALYAYIDPTTVMWANSNRTAVEAFAANSDLLAKSGLVNIYSTSTQTKSLN